MINILYILLHTMTLKTSLQHNRHLLELLKSNHIKEAKTYIYKHEIDQIFVQDYYMFCCLDGRLEPKIAEIMEQYEPVASELKNKIIDIIFNTNLENARFFFDNISCINSEAFALTTYGIENHKHNIVEKIIYPSYCENRTYTNKDKVNFFLVACQSGNIESRDFFQKPINFRIMNSDILITSINQEIGLEGFQHVYQLYSQENKSHLYTIVHKCLDAAVKKHKNINNNAPLFDYLLEKIIQLKEVDAIESKHILLNQMVHLETKMPDLTNSTQEYAVYVESIDKNFYKNIDKTLTNVQSESDMYAFLNMLKLKNELQTMEVPSYKPKTIKI